MKKILTHISKLIIILALIVSVNTATSQVSAATDTSGNFAGKDLYNKIYKTVNLDPESSVQKSIANKYGLTESQINGMVRGGDLSVLINKNKQLSLEKITAQYQKIVQDFSDELETASFKSDLESTIKPSEIFSDGDTSNSDFDLIYDLNIIEILLFNETSANDFGKKFDSPKIEIKDTTDEEAMNDLFGEDNETNDIGANDEDKYENGTNPMECLNSDNILQNALDNFDENQDTTDSSDTDAAKDNEVDSDNFPTANPDPWDAEFLCPDGAPYCIEISFDMKEAKVYQKSDNCTACHVQNINKALDKLLQKPLSPNKLTGNILEVSKCKSSFTNLPANMKIITMAVPAKQPQNKDAFFNSNLAKEWEKFNERYKPFWYSTSTETKTIEDTATKKALNNVTEDATLENVVERTNNIVEGTNQEITKDTDQKTLEAQAETQGTRYQLIINELTDMNKHFANIKEKFDQMKTPCTNISSKKDCS
ncbi:hypothetical protein KKD70_00710 [Patescibacteria group bacterium]|nr:hypothetical protein [Patescibacteria group bacterium]